MCILYNIPKNATDKYELCPLTSARLNNPYLVTEPGPDKQSLVTTEDPGSLWYR